MWIAQWTDDESVSRQNRVFLSCLTRFINHGGRFTWSGIGNVIEQFSRMAERPYTQRHVLRLLAWAAGRGLVRRVRHSAPGRPALYEAVVPGHPGYAHVKVRRRGLGGRRLLALWRREDVPAILPLDEPQQPAGALDAAGAADTHRFRSSGRQGV